VLAAALLSLTAWMAADTGWFQAFLKARLQKPLAAAVQGSLSWSSIAIRSFPVIEIRDLVLATRDGNPVITGRRVSARVELWPLVHRRLLIADLTISGLSAEYNQSTHPNLVDVFTRPQNADTTASDWSITVRHIQLDSVLLRYRDTTTQIDAQCRAVSATGTWREPTGLQLQINCPDGDLHLAQRTYAIDTLGLQLATTARSFDLTEVYIRAVPAILVRNGALHIPFTPDDSWRAEITARAEKEFFSDWPLREKGVDRCPAIDLRARMQGTPAHPNLQVEMEAQGLVLRTIPLARLAVQAQYDTAGFLTGKITLTDQIAQGTAQVKAQVPGLFSDPAKDVRYSITSRWQVRDPMRLRRFWVGTILDSVRQGQVGMTLTAAGSSLTRLPDIAACRMELTGVVLRDGRDLPDLLVTAGLRRRILTFDVRWPQVAFIAGSCVLENQWPNGQADYSIINTQPLTRMFLGQDVRGTLSGTVMFDGAGRSLSGVVRTDSGLTWSGLRLDTLEAAVRYDSTMGWELTTGMASLHGVLDSVAEVYGLPGWHGGVRAEVIARGQLPWPAVTARCTFDNPGARLLLADTISTSVTLHDRIVRLENLRLTRDSLFVAGAALYDLTMDTVSVGMKLFLSPAQTDVGTLLARADIKHDTIRDGALTLTGIPLAVACFWQPAWRVPAGVCALQAQVNGALANPAIRAVGRVERVAFTDTPEPLTLDLDARLADHTLQAVGHVTIAGSGGPLDISAIADLTPVMGKGTNETLPLTVRLQGRDVNLQPYGQIFSRNLVLAGRFSSDAEVANRSGRWQLQGGMAVDNGGITYPLYAMQVNDMQARLTAPATGEGTALNVRLTTGPLAYLGSRFSGSSLDAVFRPGLLTLDSVRVRLPEGSVAAQGQIPLVPLPQLFAHPDLRLEAALDSVPLTELNPFISGGQFLSGTAQGYCRITPGTPNTGQFTVGNLRFAPDDIQPALGPLQAGLELRDDSLVITGCRGKWGRGEVRGAGHVVLTDRRIGPAQIMLRATRLPLVYRDMGTVRMDTVRVVVTHGEQQWRLDAQALLGETDIRYEVGFRTPPPAVAGPPAPDEEPVVIAATLHIPDNLAADVGILGGMGHVRTRMGGTLQVSGTAGVPEFSGAVSLVEGTVDYLDHTFTITEGFARQPNGPELNPFISLVAQAGVTQGQGGEMAESLLVTLRISGELTNPAWELSSAPVAYTESELISLLTFGTAFLNAGDVGATSLVNRSVSAYASRQAQKLLGLEKVQIQSDFLTGGAAALTDAQIAVSKRLGRDVTLTYRRTTEGAVNQEGVLSWKILPFLFLEGQSDVQGNAGVDLKVKVQR
jgi:hypothetical protein